MPPALEGSPVLQVLLVAVAGLAAFGLTFAALRAYAGRASAPTIDLSDDPSVPDPFTFGSRADRRVAHRRKGNHVTVWIAHQENPHHEARVRDRSLGGLALSTEREYLPGTILKVRPNNGSPTAPWVDVEVKACVPQGNEWQISCGFVKTPPYAVLLMFG